VVPDLVPQDLVVLAQLLEICGAAFLILGFLVDTARWVRKLVRHREPLIALEHYRTSLGRSVLIGLEILVAATIIKTIVVEPSVEGVGLLATMVAIRTMLGWTTVLEISGRWPWQRR
jgi:uncharacterized membrane protein